jgi:replicative DNA helicase
MEKSSRKKTPFKSIKIKGDYLGWKDFYEPNKEIIYKSIIEIFEEFKTTRKKSLTLNLSAKLKNELWDTDIEFKKDDTLVLKRDILPFFEEIEDYEICSKVINLHKELTL